MKEKNEIGITLIALVVTIVVLLILAGITINLLFGNGGIFDVASQAKVEHEIGALKDRINNVIADWSIERAVYTTVTVDDLWDKMVEADIIDNPEEDVVGPEKEGENDRYEITTNEGYIVEIIVSPDGNVSIGDVVEGDKLPPKIGEITSTSNSNSIHIEVEITRSEGEVSLSYYYKKEGESEDSYKALKEGVTDLIADFKGLEQNVVYNIKVVIKDNNGTSEKEINVITGELTGVVTQKGETAWNNGTATIELETTETGVTIQYQVGGTEEKWLDYAGPISELNHGDTVFAVVTDGNNQSGYSSIDILDKLNPQAATINLTTTTAKENQDITATVTHIDNESGVDIENCKWEYNTNPNIIGTEASSYTNTFSNNGQPITLSASTVGTYYLHVLTQDVAGNKTETISQAITVEKSNIPENWQATTEDDPNWYNYGTEVNAPVLGKGMTPIIYNGPNNPGNLTSKKWANAVTSDGSMWVWIPRYAYQISSNYHTNSTSGGTINIKFLQGTTNVAYDGTSTWNNSSGQGNWNIHPGFNYSSTAEGLWVAKFEASRSIATASSVGSGNTIKIQPGVQSWRSITVNDIYTTCLNYDSTTLKDANLNSHMMKNSEWGAVAYLTQSVYGKNAEVWINSNSNYITGHAGSSASSSSTTSTSAYNNGNGPQASTTGNIYGIYDMSGGAYEFVAAYVNNGNQNLTDCALSLVNGATYTKDVYTNNGDTYLGNYNASASKYGDAVYETSSNGINMTSWYSDSSYFTYTTNPILHRGGHYDSTSNAGLFNFERSAGPGHEYFGFRPVLVIF